MGTLIGQEFYKLFHRTGTWLAIGFMVLVQVGFGVIHLAAPDYFSMSMLVSVNFVGGGLVLFIAIANTASIVASEYQFGTMKQLLYRQYYRSQVFISKVIVAAAYYCILQVIASAVTFILSLTVGKYDWVAKSGSRLAWQNYGIGIVGAALTALLLLSVVLLLSTLFKSNAAAIASGFIGYFLIQIASGILMYAISQWEWVKWNPFTFLMAGSQLVNSTYEKATMLSTPVIITGNVLWSLLFGFIAYLSFRKRSV